RKGSRLSEPHSSSPSIINFTLTGSEPWVLSQEAIALVCATAPALSSAQPRPNRRPSRSVGSNGGDFQARRLDAR
ncbi:MAG: hypothetical protein Q8R82_13615, partial [Hyphomonadaceae bacterium]|nr:hypothetical protein [Hyphomonadaceae bacterium]